MLTNKLKGLSEKYGTKLCRALLKQSMYPHMSCVVSVRPLLILVAGAF